MRSVLPSACLAQTSKDGTAPGIPKLKKTDWRAQQKQEPEVKRQGTVSSRVRSFNALNETKVQFDAVRVNLVEDQLTGLIQACPVNLSPYAANEPFPTTRLLELLGSYSIANITTFSKAISLLSQHGPAYHLTTASRTCADVKLPVREAT